MYNQRTQRFTFNYGKSLEAILYVAKEIGDLYHLMKILYFADKDHLNHYGRFITGDSYVAMRNGPVPSEVYDMIKHVRGDGAEFYSEEVKKAFRIDNNNIIPLRSYNEKKLSVSDKKCLDKAIKENKSLTFGTLMDKSHDAAYIAADQNDFIPIEDIAKTLPDSENILSYLRNMYE